ncbi:hypothetical protein HCZ00_00800 [Limosilactobacillus fermentum]
MTDLEKLEDQYPELRFWSIDVPNPHFHGLIKGTDVYINTNDDNLTQLMTALHEVFHHELDCGDLSDIQRVGVIKEEGQAIRFVTRLVKALSNHD